MSNILGTHINVRFSRIVDGDTVRVFLPGNDQDESLRLLALDTEESYAGGSKPETPWGHAAKNRAIQFFEGATQVTIEFPGNESVEDCIKKYRGNFGRLLTFVYRDGNDFQETMIREGYSPYFVKYGNAPFSEHHRRYLQAERDAQIANIGVWNQLAVNGTEMRNYAALGTWWKLRARVIDEYRTLKSKVPALLNTRLDYTEILHRAEGKKTATIFTELNGIRRVGGIHGLISYGSEDRPFNLFIPDMFSDSGQDILRLLQTRYISSGENYARRSYAYVNGPLSLYGNTPQMTITETAQITDDLPGGLIPPRTSRQTTIRISAILPDPEGQDARHETVTLKNHGNERIELNEWVILDGSGNQFTFSGSIGANEKKTITLTPNSMPLNNSGDQLFLYNKNLELQDHVSYTKQDVISGKQIFF